MAAIEEVEEEIRRLVEWLHGAQSNDGSWRFCFESGPLTDAIFIITVKALELSEDGLVRTLADRIASLQQPNGAWTLYQDEGEGNLSATIQAYCGLRVSGCCNIDHPKLVSAKRFIDEHGGAKNADLLTKVMLALIGQYRWRNYFAVPLEIVLLPEEAPIHFFDFAGYARVHLAPVLIAADQKYAMRQPPFAKPFFSAPSDTDHLRQDLPESGMQRSFFHALKQSLSMLIDLPHHLHESSLKKAEQYMLDRIEPDGTLYSYATATFLMIFALLALGYDKRHPYILKAVEGLKTLVCSTDGTTHLQNSTSTVWDTALISYALQRSGKADRSIVERAGRYLLSRQQVKRGDWSFHNPGVVPGGWGFSDINTINPDVDDTTAALRAIHRLRRTDPAYSEAWNRGLNWLVSMQKKDGGWPAFEKGTDLPLLAYLPVQNAESIAIDPSTADLTGRTLEFLGHYAGLKRHIPLVRRGVDWLLRHQEADGSWFGRWGICYIYGTWAALTGLTACGVPSEHESVRKAAGWLLGIQNRDGGWGESCKSDIEKSFVPLESTLSQTAWAVDALLAVYNRKTPEIARGIDFLLRCGRSADFPHRTYPTGATLPGSFYVYYHSYNYIWPLSALSRYAQV